MKRLGTLARLAPAERGALDDAVLAARPVPPRKEIVRHGEVLRQPYILLSGWAARIRYFRDGRRQILNVVLPGDLIGSMVRTDPLGDALTVALTDVLLMPAPAAPASESGLGRAYGLSDAIDRHYLLRQIARLGRLNADERTADFLLELRERLMLAGLASGDSFALPITQEVIADCLGLTTVHVNRTFQAMRRRGLFQIGRGWVKLTDLEHLRLLADFQPVPLDLVNETPREPLRNSSAPNPYSH